MEENKVKEPQYRGVNELRRMFLEFFESKGHLAMKSFSLVPHNDNSGNGRGVNNLRVH